MSNRQRPKRHLSVVPDDAQTQIQNSGIASKVDIPSNEKVMLKAVPAKADGVIVGEAYLYDDGSVDIQVDPNAPQWAIDKIKATEKQFGYTIGDEPDGPA